MAENVPRACGDEPKDGTLVFVTNFKTNDVSVFGLVSGSSAAGGITAFRLTLRLVETIPVGTAPQGVVIDPRARRAVVTNSGSNNLSVISITGPPVTPVQSVAQTIELVQRLLSSSSTPNAAKGFAGKKNVDQQIDNAKKEMAAADQSVAAGDFENAIAHFRLAWDAAQRAIQLAQKGSQSNQDATDVTAKETMPTEFELKQNYPNPFNSTTQIAYDISIKAENGVHVELKVYNLLGQLVNTLVDELKAPGSYTVTWRGDYQNGQPAASGVYILQIRAGDFRAARKMILMQ